MTDQKRNMGTRKKGRRARLSLKRFFYVFLCITLVLGGSSLALAQEDGTVNTGDTPLPPASAPKPAAAPNDWTGRTDILALSLTTMQYKDGGRWVDLSKSGSSYTFPADVTVESLSEFNIGFRFDIANDTLGYLVQPHDTFSVTLPDALPLSPDIASGQCYMGSVAIADFLVDHTANTITFTFTQEIDGVDTFGGGCTFELDLDQGKLNSSGATNIDIDLQNTGTPDAVITFPGRTVPSGIAKTGTYDPKTGQITWEITIGTTAKNVDLDGYTLTDAPPSGLILVSAGIKKGDALAPIPDFATNGYTFSAGDKTPQSLTVVTQVIDSVFTSNAGANITNEAVLTHGTDTEPASGAWKGTDTVSVPATDIGKTGTQVDANTIRWEIKLNTGTPANVLADAVVTDQLSTDLKFVEGSVKLNNKNLSAFAAEGADAVCDAGNLLTITMPKNINGSYTIRFDTQVENGKLPGTDPKVQNKAEMTWTVPFADGGNGKTATYGTPQIETNFNSVFLNKSSPTFDSATGRITWRIDPSVRMDSYAQAVITDTVQPDQEFVTGSVVVKNNDIPLDAAAIAAIFSIDAAARDMTFTFSDDPSKANYAADLDKIVVEYQTKALPYFTENNVSHQYKNSAHLDVDATYSDDSNASRYIKNEMLKKDAAYTFNEAENEGYMHYTAKINASKTALTNAVLTDDIGAMLTTVTDFSGNVLNGLPAPDWQLDLDKSYLDDAPNTLASLVSGGSVSYQNKLLSINLGSTGDEHALHLFVRLANKDDFFRENLKISAQNNISIAADELSGGSAAFSVSSPVTAANTIENKLSVKSSSPCVVLDSGSYIEWKADINPNGTTLSAPVVMDTLPKGLEFDSGSVALFRSTHDTSGHLDTAGSPVEASLFKAAVKDNKLTVTLPQDGDSYTLVYRTYIVSEIAGGNAKNDIALYDNDTQLDASSASEGISNSAWGYLTRTTACVIEKTDADALGLSAVSGAKYGIFTTPDADGTPFKTGVTDADGKIIFRGLTFDAQYYVKEMDASEGYTLDPAVYPYRSKMPANKVADIPPLSVAEKRVSADVTVQKTDALTSGLFLPGVTFELARTFDGAEPDGVPVGLTPDHGKYEYTGADSAQDATSATTAEDGHITFASLPRDTYILTETKPLPDYLPPDDPHFRFEVGMGGSVLFDTASGISVGGTIVNTHKEPPATPSPGPQPSPTTPVSTPPPNATGGTTPPESGSGSRQSHAAKTGDPSDPVLWIIIACGAAACAVTVPVILKKKRQ